MARAADAAGIQFRILNASKGPAVRATRAQADRALYKAVVRTALERQPNLDLFQQAVDDLILEGGTGRRGAHPDRAALPGPGRRPDRRHLPRRAHPRRARQL